MTGADKRNRLGAYVLIFSSSPPTLTRHHESPFYTQKHAFIGRRPFVDNARRVHHRRRTGADGFRRLLFVSVVPFLLTFTHEHYASALNRRRAGGPPRTP